MKVQLYASAIEHAASAFMDDMNERCERHFAGRVASFSEPFTRSPEPRVRYEGWCIFKRRVQYIETFQPTKRTLAEAESMAMGYGISKSGEGRPEFERAKRLRAIARHHKPSTLLTIEGDELDLIATFLTPSEAYREDGDGSERI